MSDRSQGQPDRSAGYLAESRWPLPILVFLLPLIAVYELGSIWLLSGGLGDDLPAHRIRAHHLLEEATRLLGASGVYLPGILVVLVLLGWHLFSGRPFRVRTTTILGMAVESVAWCVPLLVLSVITTDVLGLGQAAAGVQAAGGTAIGQDTAAASEPAGHLWKVQLLVAIGAGVYEELLFRLLGLTLTAWFLRKVVRVQRTAAAAVAILLTAVAFALFHDLATSGGAHSWGYFAYFTTLGVAFGALYLWRGFGIVVAAHALFDAVLLLLW
jgi:hypothetical protein